VSVAAFDRADHLPGRGFQGGEQAGGAVPDIVEAVAFGNSGQHRQHRSRAVQRLDLRLLVHAQHHRLRGRIQVEVDHVADLVHEQRLILNVAARCGLRPNARQIRDTADCVIPVRSANDRVDQCVELRIKPSLR
jgi:hypothetical protein